MPQTPTPTAPPPNKSAKDYLTDPEFYKLSREARRLGLSEVSDNFRSGSREDQDNDLDLPVDYWQEYYKPPPKPGIIERATGAIKGLGEGLKGAAKSVGPFTGLFGEQKPAAPPQPTQIPVKPPSPPVTGINLGQPPGAPAAKRTPLTPQEETAFQSWYAGWAKTGGINPNPDDPLHKYDYRGAFKAGETPKIASDGLYHWSSQFKDEDHPNRIVDGVDTITGQPVTSQSKPLPEGPAPVKAHEPRPRTQPVTDMEGLFREMRGVGLPEGPTPIRPDQPAPVEHPFTPVIRDLNTKRAELQEFQNQGKQAIEALKADIDRQNVMSGSIDHTEATKRFNLEIAKFAAEQKKRVAEFNKLVSDAEAMFESSAEAGATPEGQDPKLNELHMLFGKMRWPGQPSLKAQPRGKKLGFVDYVKSLVEMPGREAAQIPQLTTEGQKLIPFAGPVVESIEAYDVIQAARRVRDNEATPRDIDLLEKFRDRDLEEQARGRDMSYEIAQTVAQIPGFAAEFALTGGSFTGVKRLIETALVKGAKGLARRFAARAVAGTTGALAQTALMPQRITAEALRRMTPTMPESITRESIEEELSDVEDDFTSALAKAAPDQFVEVFSERTGGLVPAALSKLGIADRIKALKTTVMNKWVTGGENRTVAEFLEKVRSQAGWHGPISEIIEERVAEAMRAAGGIGDPRNQTPAMIDLATGGGAKALEDFVRQLMVEAVAFSVPGAVSAVARKVTAPKKEKPPEPLPGTPPGTSPSVEQPGQPPPPGAPGAPPPGAPPAPGTPPSPPTIPQPPQQFLIEGKRVVGYVGTEAVLEDGTTVPVQIGYLGALKDHRYQELTQSQVDALRTGATSVDGIPPLRPDQAPPTQQAGMFDQPAIDIEATDVTPPVTPPDQSEMIKLYRVDVPLEDRGKVADWITEGQRESGHLDAQGRWFTDTLANTEWYLKDAGGKGKVYEIEIPRAEAEKHRVVNQPENIKRFSRDPETEYFLPRELAEQKKLPPTPEPQPQPQPEVPAPTGRYSVKDNGDGTFSLINPKGLPVRRKPFTDRATAEKFAAGMQAELDEMMGTKPEAAAPETPTPEPTKPEAPTQPDQEDQDVPPEDLEPDTKTPTPEPKTPTPATDELQPYYKEGDRVITEKGPGTVVSHTRRVDLSRTEEGRPQVSVNVQMLSVDLDNGYSNIRVDWRNVKPEGTDVTPTGPETPTRPDERPTTYINGDKVEYTGKTKQLLAGTFYEFQYLDGLKEGELGLTSLAPGEHYQPATPEKKPVTPQVPTRPSTTTEKPLSAADAVKKAFEQPTTQSTLDALKEKLRKANETRDAVNPNAIDDFVSEMKVTGPGGEERAVAGMDPRMMRVLGGNLYSGNLGIITIKELFQNGMDSIRELLGKKGFTGKISVEVDSDKRTIRMVDNGMGMLPDVAVKELVDIGGSKKAADAAGGFGIAKVAIFANAESIDISTTAAEASGERITTTLKGSGEDWLDAEKGLSIKSRGASKSTPLGTAITLTLRDDGKFDRHQIRTYLSMFLGGNRLPIDITARVDGTDLTPEYKVLTERYGYSYEEQTPALSLVRTITMDGAIVDIYTSDETAPTGHVETEILNRGIPQFNMSTYLQDQVEMPTRVVADIKSDHGPEHPDYPFRVDREGLRDHADTKIRKYISSDLFEEGVTKRRNVYITAIQKAPRTTTNKHLVIDTTGKINPDLVFKIARDPIIGRFTEVVGEVFKAAQLQLRRFSGEYNNVTFGGIGLGKGYLGVNVKGEYIHGPGSKNIILINPYKIFEEIQADVTAGRIFDSEVPRMFASEIWYTIIHELSHQQSRSHGEAMVGLVTRNPARLNAINETNIQVLEEVLGDDNGATTNLIETGLDELKNEWFGTDIFKQISAGFAGKPEGGGPEGVGEGGTGTRGELGEGVPSRPDEKVEKLAPGTVAGGGDDLSVTDLAPETRNNLLTYGTHMYKEIPDYEPWEAGMVENLGEWTKPYLPTAYDLIDNVAAMTGKSPAPPPKPEQVPPPGLTPEPEDIRGPPAIPEYTDKGGTPDAPKIPDGGRPDSRSGEGGGGAPQDLGSGGGGAPGERPPERPDSGLPQEGDTESGVSGPTKRPRPPAKIPGRRFSLIGKPPIELSPNRRRQINQQVIDLIATKMVGDPLTEEEQDLLRQYTGLGGLQAASEGTLFEHYTSYPIAEFHWSKIQAMGFPLEDAIALDPSSAVGNYTGFAPQGVKMYMVEIDPVSAKVAQLLYPESDVRNMPFEHYMPRGKFDLAASNIPFNASRGPLRYSQEAEDYKDISTLHDFFFIKSLDLVRPNGLVTFLTSTGTMDKIDPEARKLINAKAEFLGAYRTPGGAFQKNTQYGGSVDIIFLRRRVQEEIDHWNEGMYQKEWIETVGAKDNKYGGNLSLYYVNHPEKAWGKLEAGYGVREPTRIGVRPEKSEGDDNPLERYFTQALGDDIKYKARETTVAPPSPVDLDPDLIYIEDVPPSTTGVARRVGTLLYYPKKKIFGFVGNDGKVYKAALPDSPNTRNRILASVQIMEDAEQLHGALRKNDLPAAQGIRIRLKGRLEKYQDEYGSPPGYDNYLWRFLNGGTAKKSLPFSDPRVWILAGLTDKSGKPTDIFTRNTLYVPPPKPKDFNPTDLADTARAYFENTGNFNLEDIAGLYTGEKLTAEEIATRLVGSPGFSVEALIADKPVLAIDDEYLFGEMWRKVDETRQMIEQVEAAPAQDTLTAESQGKLLRALQEQEVRLLDSLPEQATVENMPIDPFAAFMPDSVIARWGTSLIPRANLIKVFEPSNNRWFWRDRNLDHETFEFDDQIYNVDDLFLYLNHRRPMMDISGDPNHPIWRFDLERQLHLEKLDEAFQQWAKRNPTLFEPLVPVYNRSFRSYRHRTFEGKQVALPGLSTKFKGKDLKVGPHQWQVVAQMAHQRSGIIAHAVGGGKTMSGILLLAIEKKEGRIKKPAVIVPAKVIKNWANEIIQIFPDASVIELSGMNAQNRYKTLQRVTASDADFVLFTYEGMKEIPLQASAQYMAEDIAAFEERLRQMRPGQDPRTQTWLQNQIRRKREQIAKLQSMRRTDTVFFEDLGIDAILGDEFHNFKNAPVSYGDMSDWLHQGDASQRASDMGYKTRWIHERRGGRRGQNVWLLTATPTPNNPIEIYSMMKYVAPAEWTDRGIMDAGDFVLHFGDVASVTEPGPDAVPITRTVFRGYHHLRDLRAIFRRYIDLRTTEELGVERPDADYQDHVLEPSMDVMFEAGRIAELDAYVRREPRGAMLQGINHLSVISLARKLAADPAIYDPAKYLSKLGAPGSKLATVMQNVIANDTGENTQLIFAGGDGAPYSGGWKEVTNQDEIDAYRPNPHVPPPKAKYKYHEQVNLHKYIKEKLIESGVPASQIEIINQETNSTPLAKFKLQQANAEGKVRFLIGTTQSMGEGMNLQSNTTDIHHYDVPWTPAGLEQREGRGLRQGNANDEVRIHRYLTKGTSDAKMYAVLARKARWNVELWKGEEDDVLDFDQNAENYSDLSYQTQITAEVRDFWSARRDVELLGQIVTIQEANLTRETEKRDEVQNDLTYRKSRLELLQEKVAAGDGNDNDRRYIEGHTAKIPEVEHDLMMKNGGLAALEDQLAAIRTKLDEAKQKVAEAEEKIRSSGVDTTVSDQPEFTADAPVQPPENAPITIEGSAGAPAVLDTESTEPVPEETTEEPEDSGPPPVPGSTTTEKWNGATEIGPPDSKEMAREHALFWLKEVQASIDRIESGQGKQHDERVITQGPIILARLANFYELGDIERWKQEQESVSKASHKALTHSITNQPYHSDYSRKAAAHYKPFVENIAKILAGGETAGPPPVPDDSTPAPKTDRQIAQDFIAGGRGAVLPDQPQQPSTPTGPPTLPESKPVQRFQIGDRVSLRNRNGTVIGYNRFNLGAGGVVKVAWDDGETQDIKEEFLVPSLTPSEPPLPPVEGIDVAPLTILLPNRSQVTKLAYGVAPGLAVHRKVVAQPDTDLFVVTHTPSSVTMGPPMERLQAIRTARRLADLGDWTRSVDQLKADAQFLNEAQRVIKSDPEGGFFTPFEIFSAFRKATPKTDPALLAAQDPDLKEMVSATVAGRSKNVFQRIKHWPYDIYSRVADRYVYEWANRDYPWFIEQLRRIKDAYLDASHRSRDELSVILHGLDSSETEILRQLIYFEDVAETKIKDPTVPIPGLKKTLEEIEAEIERLKAGATPETLAGLDRWNALMEAIADDLIARKKLNKEAKRFKYFPNRVIDHASKLETMLPGIPQRLKTPYRWYLRERKGHEGYHDADVWNVAHRYLVKVHLDNAIDDFGEMIGDKYHIVPSLTDEQRATMFARTGGKAEPGEIYEAPDGREYMGYQLNEGRANYPTVSFVTDPMIDLIAQGIRPEDMLRIGPAGGTYYDIETENLPEVVSVRRTRSIGGLRQVWVIPKEIALRLIQLRVPESGFLASLGVARAVTIQKHLILGSRPLKYNIQNIMGDNFNLYMEDAHAFLKIPEALELLLAKTPNAEQLNLIELMKAARGIQSSAFMFEARASSLSEDPRFDAALGTSPVSPSRLWRATYGKYETAQGIREAVPRVAKFLADYERIINGEMPVARGVDIAGLSPIEAAGKIMRVFAGDYGATSPAFRREISGLWFPFATWYVKNGEVFARRLSYHFPWTVVGTLLKYIVPLALLWLWNRQFPEVEKNLKDWEREYPYKFVTGYQSESGNPIVYFFQDPASVAMSWVGLQRLPFRIGQLNRGELTFNEFAGEMAKDMIAAAPIVATWNKGLTFEGVLGEQFNRLKQPLVQIGEGILSNRDPYTRYPIVPDRVEDLDRTWPTTPAGQKLMWNFVTEKLIAPYAQYLREVRSIEADTWEKLISARPWNIPEAFGRAEVNTEAARRQVQREQEVYWRGVYNQKLHDIETVYYDWIAGDELTPAERDAAYTKIAKSRGPIPSNEAISNRLASVRVARATIDLALKAPSISGISPRLPDEWRKKLAQVRTEEDRRKVLLEERKRINLAADDEHRKGLPESVRPYVDVKIPKGIFAEPTDGEIPTRPDQMSPPQTPQGIPQRP